MVDKTVERSRYIFDVPFLRYLGVTLVGYGPESCETALDVTANHLQQDGFVHAGVQATLADHTAGAASVIASGRRVLTVEFKINLLRPALGTRLSCKARILKSGRRLVVVESDVFVHRDESTYHTARASVTLMPMTEDG